MNVNQIELLKDYVNNKEGCINYINDITSKLKEIRENPENSRKIATELNKWVSKEGHILRYHMDRLALVLANQVELEGCKKASDVRKKVVVRLVKNM